MFEPIIERLRRDQLVFSIIKFLKENHRLLEPHTYRAIHTSWGIIVLPTHIERTAPMARLNYCVPSLLSKSKSILKIECIIYARSFSNRGSKKRAFRGRMRVWFDFNRISHSRSFKENLASHIHFFSRLLYERNTIDSRDFSNSIPIFNCSHFYCLRPKQRKIFQKRQSHKPITFQYLKC